MRRRWTLAYLLCVPVCLGFVVDAAMSGRWFGVLLNAVGAVGFAFHATHPDEWWDAKARRIIDQLERER